MKNLSTGLSLVSLVAVAILFVLHFSNSNNEAAAEQNAAATEEPTADAAPSTDVVSDAHQAMADGTFRVAVVNMDSLNKQLHMMDFMLGELKRLESSMMASLQAKQNALQDESIDFQRKAELGALTETAAQQKYQELMQREQQLQMDASKEEQRFFEKQENLNVELRETVDEYLERYNQEHKFDLILRCGTVSEVLRYDGASDITQAVVEGLNKEYDASKE